MENEVVNQGRKQTAGGGRGLWIVLGILCVVIVGLIVGIVVVSLNSGRSQDTQVTENSEEMSEEQIEAQNYKDSFDKVRAEAKKLLAENPVDPTKIISLYSPYIEKSLADKMVDRASAYIRAEQDDLLTAGYKQAALDELLKLDFSVFNEPEQYKYYLEITELAKDLNRSDVVAKYEPLVAQTKEAYDRNYAAAERAAAEGAAARARAEQNQGGDE